MISGESVMSQDLVAVVTALALYLAVVVSPGPSFALISRLAVSGARSAALEATLGLALGGALYAVLTMAGLAVLLEEVGWLARLIQVAGACYLIYLGIDAWRSSSNTMAAGASPMAKSTTHGIRTGFLVCLANPKAIAFFIGLYAVAVPQGTALWAKVTIVAGGFAIEILWYGLVTLLLSTRPVRAVYDRFRVGIERIVGTVLAVFGLRVLWEKP
jgi:threonine/homoserine/homoserine lactone efflux protein